MSILGNLFSFFYITRKDNRLVWMTFFSILGLLILPACKKGNTQSVSLPEKPLVVSVIEAQPRNLPAILELIAQTEGAKETEVRARIGGILLKQLFKDGPWCQNSCRLI